MILAGLKPETIMEIASRAISFWTYQVKRIYIISFYFIFSLFIEKKKASFEISVLLKVMLSCSARDKKTQDILRLIRFLVLLFLFVLITQARLCFRVMAVTYTDVDLNLKCLPQISRLTVSRLHP